MSDAWSNAQAKEEGWYLIAFGGHPEIQAWYDYELFTTKPHPFKTVGSYSTWDLKALAFVQAKAREGSAYHIESLARTQLL